jgi:hypothetical protein
MGSDWKTPLKMLALAITFILSPLKPFAQDTIQPGQEGKKIPIFSDPFSSAGEFINPAAAAFSPGSIWTSLCIRPGAFYSGPILLFRHDGKNIGETFKLDMAPDQQNAGQMFAFVPQAMVFAHIDVSEKAAIYPLVSYEVEVSNHKLQAMGYMVGMGASGDVWKLCINGYVGFAGAKGFASLGAAPLPFRKGAVAGLGWVVKGRIFEVHHALHKDFRTGGSVFTVDTRFRPGGVLFQAEKDKARKIDRVWLGLHWDFGKNQHYRQSRIRGSAFIRANLKDKFRPVAGVILQKY